MRMSNQTPLPYYTNYKMADLFLLQNDSKFEIRRNKVAHGLYQPFPNQGWNLSMVYRKRDIGKTGKRKGG